MQPLGVKTIGSARPNSTVTLPLRVFEPLGDRAFYLWLLILIFEKKGFPSRPFFSFASMFYCCF